MWRWPIIANLRLSGHIRPRTRLGPFLKRNQATSSPLDLYAVLGVPRSAEKSEIKSAFFLQVRGCHPDLISPEQSEEERQRLKLSFLQLTMAYETLMDDRRRANYDKHGLTDMATKQGFSHADDQSYHEAMRNQVHDDLRSRGHSLPEEGEYVSMRQRCKNAYAEFTYGLDYFNFPWRLRIFALSLLFWGSVLFFVAKVAVPRLGARVEALPDSHPLKPQKLNNRFNNDSTKDILFYIGLRKTAPKASGTNSNEYDAPKLKKRLPIKIDPKTGKVDSLYSNTVYGQKSSKRHAERLRHLEEHKELKLRLKHNMLKERKRRMDEQFSKVEKELEEQSKKVEMLS